MNMRVTVMDHTNNKKVQVELPANVPMERLLPVLAARMQLPLQQNGQPIIYRFDHDRTGRRLDDKDTLETAEVQRDDLLRLLPEITAGNIQRRRLARLEADYAALQALVTRSPLIFIDKTSGSPPEEYEIRFTCRGISSVDSLNRPVYSENHRVYIRFTAEYPAKPPQMRWLTPLFHPNVSAQGTQVCISTWYPAKTLDDLVMMLGRMIQFQNYNPYSALNVAAAKWCDMHRHLLPTDDRQLRTGEKGAVPDSFDITILS